MEDDKLAAYYDELTRKGGGAARFKQGLGFSASNDSVPDRGSALPATTSTSFLSSFVRASSPSKPDQFDNKAQLKSIQNKLTKNPQPKTLNLDTKSRSRSRSPTRRRSRSRDRHSRRRIRSRSRDRHSRRRSRSRSRERRSRRGHRSRSRSRENNRERRKREESPEKDRKGKGGGSGNGSGTDFAKLIQGYDHMTPAERVKAKMKLQLSRTAENDEAIGKGSGWERFDFDKDAPLDDEEIEAGEDDAAVVKHIGQSFRFSAVEARNEEQIRAAHDEAMFGASSCPPPAESEHEVEGEDNTKQNNESAPVTNLLSDKVLTMQRGSWRDRARKT